MDLNVSMANGSGNFQDRPESVLLLAFRTSLSCFQRTSVLQAQLAKSTPEARERRRGRSEHDGSEGLITIQAQQPCSCLRWRVDFQVFSGELLKPDNYSDLECSATRYMVFLSRSR